VKSFIFDRPDGFSFKPGQYCWISLPNSDYQPAPMAIASGNKEDYLKFSIRAWGDLTNALFGASIGDEVTIDGPHGSGFPEEKLENQTTIHLIAGGTGITPVRSLVHSLNGMGQKSVYYGAKSPEELLYQDQLSSWPGTVHLTVDQGNENWSGNIGLVTDLLEPVEFSGGLPFCMWPQTHGGCCG